MAQTTYIIVRIEQVIIIRGVVFWRPRPEAPPPKQEITGLVRRVERRPAGDRLWTLDLGPQPSRREAEEHIAKVGIDV